MSSQLGQSVLVISCAPNELEPVQLIRDIMEIEGDPPSEVISIDRHNLTLYPWHINTKYYDADIHFVELKERDIVSQHFCNSIQAVVIFFNNHDEDSFKAVETWMPFVNEYEAEIKILVCKTAEEGPLKTEEEEGTLKTEKGGLKTEKGGLVPKVRIQKWCISNGFELVEINPLDDRSDDDDTEDDFIESRSVRRIMQALHAHPWPNLVLKSIPQYTPSSKFQELLANESSGNGIDSLSLENGINSLSLENGINSLSLENGINSLSSTQDRRNDAESRVDSLLEENKLLFQGLDEQNGDFENLFDKFVDMKEQAANLTGEERRLFAERTAMAFYKALGGEDEDASDGSDDLHL